MEEAMARFEEPLEIVEEDEGKAGVTVIDPTWLETSVGIDVVAVHGLRGHRSKTWATLDNAERLWLHDAFSEGTSFAARVISYGYDPNDSLKSCYTLNGIYQMAEELLAKLLELRSEEIKDARRPIFWVSHDLGGLVVKAALVLAQYEKEKYADILRSTRVLIFFGCPHRSTESSDLLEQLLRLISLHLQLRFKIKVASALSQTVTEINGAFIHTQMLTQAILVNSCSSHPDISESVFSSFTASFGVDGEIVLSNARSHLDLPSPTSPTEHPLKGKPDSDWRWWDCDAEELRSMQRVLDQIPPTYPLSHPRHLLDGSTELKELMKPETWNHVVHIRCETDAKLTSEECFRALQRVRANIWQFQFYFNFNSDDIRFSSLEPWFASIFSHIVFSRTVTFDPSNTVSTIGRYIPWTLEGGMAYCWNHLIFKTPVMDAVYVLGCFDKCRESQALWLISQIGRQFRSFEDPLKIVIVTTKNSNHGHKITEALSQLPEKSVTTLDYSGAPVIPPKENLDERLEIPLFLQEDPRYAEVQTSDTIRRMYASCRADGDLARLLLTLMKSSPDSMKTMQLFRTDLPLRDQIFTASLEAISAKNRSRALKVISWLSTFRRPLRVFEFVALHQLPEFVCDTGCLQHSISRKDPRMSYKAGQILRDLGGLLHIKDDEVHFSHPELRSWLLSVGAYPASESQWLHLENECERHADAVDICVKCLSHLNGDESTDGLFAYAVEHWTHHYTMANGLRHNAILNNIFGDFQLLNNWIAAYGRLQTPFVKPRPGASKPLPIAAHFSLDSVVKSLITKESIHLSIWSEAILECVRTGHLSTLLVLYEARPTELEFDNDVLHDIVKEAALSGHSDVFREVVRRIPEAPHEKPGWKAITMRPAEKHVPHSGEHAPSEAASHSPPRSVSGVMAQDTSQTKRQQDLLLTQPTEDDECAGHQDKDNKLRKICTDMDHYGQPSQGQGSNPQIEDQESKSPIGSSPPVPITPFDWLHLILCCAARYGVQDAVDRLLSLGANVNTEAILDPKIGKTNALTQASRRGYLATMRSLLDHGGDPEFTSEDKTPLMFAVQGGNCDVVKLLLEKGADVEATDDDNWMAVTYASYWGCYAIVKTLIQHAPQIEHMVTGTPPPLLQAAMGGRYNTMKILLENGVDANSADGDHSALTFAILQERHDICELLLNSGEGWTAADPNFTPENSMPPLVGATWTYNLEIVKLLLEQGADIQKADERDRWYRTPLSVAIGLFEAYSKIDLIRHLLENNADPLVADELGWTPLWTAANEGHAEVVRLLLTAGAAPSMETPCGENGWTPLCTAVVQEHTDVIQVLVEFGADVNREVESGATPIALAVGSRDAESIQHLLSSPKHKPDLKHPSVKLVLLDEVRWSDNCQEALDMVLAAGADVDMAEQTGAKAPLLMAAMANPTPLTNKLAQTILMYGPSVDFKDEFGNTVLTRISPYTSVNTIKILLRRGAKLDVVNGSGDGPLIAAIGADNMDVFNFLLTQDVVKSSVNTPSAFGTSLHRAVRVDNIEMVKTLIQSHGANIDFSEEFNYGTPIMTAIILLRDSITKMLLDSGAQLTRPAGLFSFPINIAGLTAHPTVIRLLLDRPGVSIDVRDRFERKPAHLACLNSLEAFNELCIPDGDFAAKDQLGRVPLHFAALSGNVELMEVVLERSQRVGVDINVKDDDGWTPLLWAARFSEPVWTSSSSYMPQEMIKYLLNNEAVDASVLVGGIGADKDDKSWSAADIAEYSDHQADPAVISLLRGRVTKKGMSSNGRGKRGVDTQRRCDCCLARMYGIHFRCLDCDTELLGGFDLCFKCAYYKSKLHPSGHRLSKYGEELDVHDGLDTPVLEGGSPAPQDLVLDQPVYEGEDDAADATETDMIDDRPEYENGEDSDDH